MSKVQRVALDGLSREELMELVTSGDRTIAVYEKIVAEKDRQFDEMRELVDELLNVVEMAERVVEKSNVLMEKKDRRIQAAKKRISRLKKKSVAARDGKLKREGAARRHVKKRGADP